MFVHRRNGKAKDFFVVCFEGKLKCVHHVYVSICVDMNIRGMFKQLSKITYWTAAMSALRLWPIRHSFATLLYAVPSIQPTNRRTEWSTRSIVCVDGAVATSTDFSFHHPNWRIYSNEIPRYGFSCASTVICVTR